MLFNYDNIKKKFTEYFRALKTHDFNKLGLVCNCISSCTEPEYNVLSKEIGS